MKIRFKKGILISLIAIALVLLTCVSAFAVSFDYDGTGSSTSGGSSTLANKSFSIFTDDIDDLVVAYRFSVADSKGNIISKRVDVYNNSWCVYSDATTYKQLYAVKNQYSKRSWINGTATEFNNNSKISNLSGFNYIASSSIDSTMPQSPSKIGTWLSKNDYANSKKLFEKCAVTPQNGYRLIVEPIIQVKLDSACCAVTPTELAVYGGKAYNYDKVSSYLTPGTFSTLNNYVQMKFPNMLRTNSKQTNLWDAAPALSSRTSYGNVINKGYGVSIVNATEVQKEYTVTFKPNGGSFIYNGTTYTSDTSFTVKGGTSITMPTCTRNYWYFTGWTTNGTNDYNASTAYTVNSNVTFYANYNPLKIQYNTNGGTISSSTYSQNSSGLIQKNKSTYYYTWPNSGSYSNTRAYTTPQSDFLYNATSFGLSKTGYVFAGWSKTSNPVYGVNTTYSPGTSLEYTSAVESSDIVSGGVETYYAVWVPINVLYDINLNSASGYESSDFDTPINIFTMPSSKGVLQNTSSGTYSGYDTSYTFDNTTSTVTLNGYVTNAIFTINDVISEGDVVYMTLVYKSGSYTNKGSPRLLADAVLSNGNYIGTGRNAITSGTLPTASNPIITKSITIAEGRSSFRYAFYSSAKDSFDNYSMEVYITIGKPVTDLDLIDYYKTESIINNAYGLIKSVGEIEYVTLPAAQSYNTSESKYITPTQTTHPFGYKLNSWNTSIDGTGTTVRNTTVITNVNKSNHTVYAQWTPNKLAIFYDTNATDAILTNPKFNNSGNDTVIKNSNGSYYAEVYSYNNPITVRTDTNFGLVRKGYTFGGWIFKLYGENYANGQETSVEELFKGYSDTTLTGTAALSNGNVFVAQWIPNNYTVEFWTDLGLSDSYLNYVSHGYSGATTENWNTGDAAEGLFQYANNNFYRADNTQTFTYDEEKELLENKYTFFGHKYNGWYAYSESMGKYCTGYDSETGEYIWNTAEEINENSLSLYLISGTVQGLTHIDGDVIRMYAVPEYTNETTNPDPDDGSDTDDDFEPYPWTSSEYSVYYCGTGADGYNYNNTTYINKNSSLICPITNISEYVCQDPIVWTFDIDNFNEYISNECVGEPKDYVHTQSNSLVKNQFTKTGCHTEASKTWIATMNVDDNVLYYGFDSYNKLGWYLKEEITAYRYFIDGETNLVNLTANDGDIIYMHPIWEVNQYKVYYCGNGADGQTYGQIDVSDENGSMFSYSHPTIDCPISSGDGCKYGDYFDETVWLYDSEAKPLYTNKFTKTGYLFDGWRAYDSNTNKWYGYSSSSDELGWYDESSILKYYTFTDKESVKNLSSTNNGIIYMTAQWTPIPYYIQYNSNGGTGEMSAGAYSGFVLGKIADETTLYYDNTYYLRINTFTYSDRVFSGWRLLNESGKWYGLKSNVIGWYSTSDFENGSAEYIDFSDTTVKNGILYAGDAIKNLTVVPGETITAYAQWLDETIVYYNTNSNDATTSIKYKQYSDNYILETGILNSEKYSQIFYSNNLDTRQNYGLSTNVTINDDSFFSLSRHGYTFKGWNSESDGTGISYQSETAIELLRDGGNATSDIGSSETTLYAQWSPNKYKIYYCGNGATSHYYASDVIDGNVDSSHICTNYNYCNDTEYSFDETVTLSSNRFIYEGYTFIGWSEVPNPGEDDLIYPDTASIKGLSATDGDIVYLYAQWVPASFYYNANYNGLLSETGDGYTLNSNDDVCDLGGQRLLFDFVGGTIEIKEHTDFGLGLDNYGFVGWSKDKNGTNILTPGSYSTQEILNYFGTFESSEVPLYAIWSSRSVSFSYNVNKDYINNILSSTYSMDDDGFITIKNEVYKNSFYNATVNTIGSIHNINDFSLVVSGDYVFDYWIARKTINGVEYYLDKNIVWRSYNDNNLASYEPYQFKNNETIQNASNSVSFEDLFQDELYSEDANANINFYAVWVQPLDYVVNIQYKVDASIVNDITTGSTLSIDSDGYICSNNSDGTTKYIETFYLLNGDDDTLTNTPVFVKSVGDDGFDISYDYHKFVDWYGKSSGKNFLSNLMTDTEKAQLRNNKNVTITLIASWKENQLTVKYNVNGGDASNASLNDSGYVLNADNTLFTETWLASATNVLLKNCDSEFGFNKIGHTLSGYIVGNNTISINDINDKRTAISLAPELKTGDAEVTVFADWLPNEINIIYNANTGTIDSGNYYVNTINSHISIDGLYYKQSVSYNNQAKILNNDFFSLYHPTSKFVGWNTAIDGSGISFSSDKYYTIFDYVDEIEIPSQDIVLYAQWEPDSYSVYYCGNGADGQGYESYLSTLKEGDEDYGSVFSKNSLNECCCNDATCDSVGNYYHNREWEYNQKYTLANNLFTRTGYVFAGYWTDIYGNQYAEGTQVENIPIDENGVAFLYAQWIPISYVIEYDGNGATMGLVPEQELVYNQVDTLNENSFAKDYYHSNPDICWVASREINGITYYCTSYDKTTYQTTWTPESSVDITTDAYKFTEGEEVKNLTDIDNDIVTMHAVWEPNELTITYNTNGGIVSSDDFYVKSDEFINSTISQDVYEQKYVYDENNTSVSIKNSNYFGMVHESDNDVYFVFTGWALDKTAYVPDYTNKNLYNIAVDQLAPSLKFENVNIKLYAMWDEVDEMTITYYEGELVEPETLVDDFNSVVSFPDAYFEIGTSDGSPFLYPATISGFKPGATDYGTYEVDGLYTYFEKLEKDEVVKIVHSFYPNVSNNDKYLFFYIDIIYNNVPEITACDRWYTIEEALAGKITEQDLLKTAIAEDVESGNISHLLEIVNFDSYNFNKVGDYEITYTVTDDIPVNGQNKTNTKTITVHIVDSYANEKVRFISDGYYPLMSNIYIDENGYYKAKKVNGILYYVDANNELCLDTNGDAYPVDAGLTAKTLINADSSYTIIPLSKWYRDNECIASLQNCLNNTKDESGNWTHVEEIWSFSSNEIKAIRENLKNNIYDENFYANQYVNGHCVSVTNKSAISQSYDIGQNQISFLSVSDSVIQGFDSDADINTWNELFAGYLVIPKTVIENSDDGNANIINIDIIASNAFTDNDYISIVRIPSTITEIESGAFYNCPNLTTVYIEASEECITIYEDSFDSDVTIKYIQ